MAQSKFPSRLESQVSVDAQPSNMYSSMPSFPPGVTRGFSFETADSFNDSNRQEMQRLIDQYYDRMPSDVKIGYFDVMILYAEDDRELATKYRDHLMNDIVLEGGRKVMAVLYDDEELVSMAGGKLKSLDYGFQRCTFAFIYLTKSFCQCEWSTLSSEECLMESIYNPEKKWCVVPVYTVSRSKANFKIPMGLNSLKGVNYYNDDDFYRRGLRRLIGDKVMVRLAKSREHFRKQYNYACQIRNEDIVKRKHEEDLHRYQEMKRRELELLQERKMTQRAPAVENTDRLSDADIINNQEKLLEKCQSSSKQKKDAVESLDRGNARPGEQDERYSINKPKFKGKPGKSTVPNDQAMQSTSLVDIDYATYISMASPKEEMTVRGQEVVVKHFHFYPDGPGEVTKTYNIYRADNVAIGENATIVSSNETELVHVDYEEEEEENASIHSGRTSIRSTSTGRSTSIDAAPSSAPGEPLTMPTEPSTGNSLQPRSPLNNSSHPGKSPPDNPPGLRKSPPVNSSGPGKFPPDATCNKGNEKERKTPDSDKTSNSKDFFSERMDSNRSNPNSLQKGTSIVKPKPLMGVAAPRQKPVVAMVSPMQSFNKPSSEKEETVVKQVVRDTDPECTEVKQTTPPSIGNANSDLEKVVPKHFDDDSEETLVKKIAPVSHIKPQVVSMEKQGCCEPSRGMGNDPSIEAPATSVKTYYENDVVEDGEQSDSDLKRDSGGFVEVKKEDLAFYVDAESMGTDVDSGMLTKDEKGLECVKHALNIGYSEKKIKQALLKLRVKGKVDINLLLDEMNDTSDTASPPSNTNPVSKFEISGTGSAKTNDSNSRQKPGILQRFFNFKN